jgi:hypothetical protein
MRPLEPIQSDAAENPRSTALKPLSIKADQARST